MANIEEGPISSFAKTDDSEGKETPETKELPIQDRLAALIRSISGKPRLEVTTRLDPDDLIELMQRGQDPRRAWFKKNRIDRHTGQKIGDVVHIPDRIINMSENAAKGIASHEASHVAITRDGEFIPDQVMQQLGFHALLASVEERATDQAVRDRFEGAGLWVDEARREENPPYSPEKIREKMKTIPKFAQLQTLITYHPHMEDIVSYYDPDVVALYETIRPAVEQAEHHLPRENAAEDEIMQKAIGRYKIIYSHIWPHVKHLITEDIEQEKEKQLLRQKENPLENLPPEIMEALNELMQQIMDELSEKEGPGDEEAPSSEPPSAEEPSEGESPTPSELPSESLDGGPEGEETSSPATPEGEPAPSEETSGSSPLSPDELSPELQAALKNLIDKLPQDVKDELARRALKALQELEDELVEELTGQLEENPAETHEKYRRRKEAEEVKKQQEDEKRAADERLDAEMKEIERRQAAMQSGKDKYDEAYHEIREFEDQLFRRLEEIFVPNIKRAMKLSSTGNRINLPAVFRWDANRQAGIQSMDNRIFEKVHQPEKSDYTISILVDLSSSMSSSGKIEQTFKAVVLLCEILSRLGIKYEIAGFQDEVIEFKDFEEKLTDDTRRKISGMLGEVNDENPGGHNHSSYNDDGPCLLRTSARLAAEPGKEKFLLVLSDGRPAGLHSDEDDLRRAVSHILSSTDQKLIGIGLGKGTEHVQRFYPASLPDMPLADLPESLGNLLEDMINNPQRYASQKSWR